MDRESSESTFEYVFAAGGAGLYGAAIAGENGSYG
jgi:hypothetical protein